MLDQLTGPVNYGPCLSLRLWEREWVVCSPQRLYLFPLTVMRGRKLDTEAKHNDKHAASSAPERIHGMCIYAFDHSHLLPYFLMILSSSLFACFCFHSLSQTSDVLSRLFKYRFLFYFFFLRFQLCLPSLPQCVSGLKTELVHEELASGWRHYSCLIDGVRWKRASDGHSRISTKLVRARESRTSLDLNMILQFYLFWD